MLYLTVREATIAIIALTACQVNILILSLEDFLDSLSEEDLSSQHLDIEPGDREADCGGTMEPVAVWVRKNGEWAIIHRCKICGTLSSNRIAADDNPMKLMSIAMKPVSSPPFPLEKIEKMTKLMGGDGELKW